MKKDIKSNTNNLSGLDVHKIGGYTKGAVERFEENIVNQTNYLEKVEKGLNYPDKKNK